MQSITHKDLEFWRNKANDYEWLYKEQKDISDGYKKIIDEYRLLLMGNSGDKNNGSHEM